MNAVHLHLVLNHAPFFGVLLGAALLAFAVWRRADNLKRFALGIFVLAALVSVPVYLTGEPAEHRVEGLPGVSHAIVEQHEEAAVIAFVGILALGAIALGGLVWAWRKPAVPRWIVSTVLPAALVVTTLTAWTANLGGQVRHSEIRPDAPPAIQSTAAEHNED